ncbi:MAG: hypothetical protein J5501_07680 [Ruminococcus sp.]|nr:hypothetical protein [Ruminococcus sp.]
MKILNLHGFLGAADNRNYKALCGIVPAETIISPKMLYQDRSPEELLPWLSGMIVPEETLFVGQSLGCWYADRLSRIYSRPCILTNPCYFPAELELIYGLGMPEEYRRQYRELSPKEKNPLAYTICGDEDTLIPGNMPNCERLSAVAVSAHGGHSSIEPLGDYLEAAFAVVREW